MIKARLKHAETAATARNSKLVGGCMSADELALIREFHEGDTLALIPAEDRTPEQVRRLAELEAVHGINFALERARLDALVG